MVAIGAASVGVGGTSLVRGTGSVPAVFQAASAVAADGAVPDRFAHRSSEASGTPSPCSDGAEEFDVSHRFHVTDEVDDAVDLVGRDLGRNIARGHRRPRGVDTGGSRTRAQATATGGGTGTGPLTTR